MALLDDGRWNGNIFQDGWVPGGGGDAAVIEPATGEELGRVGVANAADIARAAARAAEAQRTWADTMYQDRAAIVRRAGSLFQDNAEEIQGWIMRETGAIPPKARSGDLVRGQHVLRVGRPGLAALRRAPPDARSRAEHVAAAAGRRGRGHLAVQLPADPVDPRRGARRSRSATP